MLSVQLGGDTTVELAVDNIPIRRTKSGKDVNLYQKDGIKYAAFGTDVPNDITELLNLNEINLQAQMDSPFLISSTPGDVAKHFNQIAHLDQIDSGLKNVQKEIFELVFTIGKEAIKDTPATGLIKQLNDARENLKKFDHLEKFEIDVEILENMQTKFLQKVNNSRLLKTLIEAILTTQNLIDTQSEILTLEPQLNKVLGWMAERKHVEESCDNLGALITELKGVEEDIEDHTYIVTAEKPVNDLQEMFVKKAELNDLSQSIGKLITNITHTENALQNASNKVKTLEKVLPNNVDD